MYLKDDFLKEVIFDLLVFGRVDFSRTNEFKIKKHNNDLVPAFNDKLNEIIDYFNRYRKISYDIQGVRDCGIDVLIKYEVDGSKKLIGIQVKSYDDIKAKDWLSKLKAQLIDVQSNYSSSELTDYYVVMCTDIEKHKDKIRNATADLLKIKEFNIHIIQPENALYFLELPDWLIGSYLKRKFSTQDYVIEKAEDSLVALSLAQSAMVIEAAGSFVSRGKIEFNWDEIAESSFVSEVYDKFPNYPASWFDDTDSLINEEELDADPINDLQIIADKNYFYLPTYTDSLSFKPDRYFALIALMYDAKVRYWYDDKKLKWYAFHTLKENQITYVLSNSRP